MGVCTETFITRKDALKLLKKFMKEQDNRTLEDILYSLIGSEHSYGGRLKAFTIVHEYDPANEDRNYHERT